MVIDLKEEVVLKKCSIEEMAEFATALGVKCVWYVRQKKALVIFLSKSELGKNGSLTTKISQLLFAQVSGYKSTIFFDLQNRRAQYGNEPEPAFKTAFQIPVIPAPLILEKIVLALLQNKD